MDSEQIFNPLFEHAIMNFQNRFQWHCRSGKTCNREKKWNSHGDILMWSYWVVRLLLSLSLINKRPLAKHARELILWKQRKWFNANSTSQLSLSNFPPRVVVLANANTIMHYLAYIIHTISHNANFRKRCLFSGAKLPSIDMSLGNAFLVSKYGLKIGLKRSFENKNVIVFQLTNAPKGHTKTYRHSDRVSRSWPSDRWSLLKSFMY